VTDARTGQVKETSGRGGQTAVTVTVPPPVPDFVTDDRRAGAPDFAICQEVLPQSVRILAEGRRRERNRTPIP
jgi:hypothetical protein